MDGVKKEPMQNTVSKGGRKFYLKTELKLPTFLAKSDVVTKFKEFC
jgi:hypothetical protein